MYFTKFRLSGKTLGIIWALKAEGQAGLSVQALGSGGALVALVEDVWVWPVMGSLVGLHDGQPATSGPPGGPRMHARAQSRGIASGDPSSNTRHIR